MSAQNAFDSLSNVSAKENPRLAWLERQLAHIIAQLHGLQDDVDCGWINEGESEEILGDVAISIANLKSLIETAKMIGR